MICVSYSLNSSYFQQNEEFTSAVGAMSKLFTKCIVGKLEDRLRCKANSHWVIMQTNLRLVNPEVGGSRSLSQEN